MPQKKVSVEGVGQDNELSDLFPTDPKALGPDINYISYLSPHRARTVTVQYSSVIYPLDCGFLEGVTRHARNILGDFLQRQC